MMISRSRSIVPPHQQTANLAVINAVAQVAVVVAQQELSCRLQRRTSRREQAPERVILWFSNKLFNDDQNYLIHKSYAVCTMLLQNIFNVSTDLRK